MIWETPIGGVAWAVLDLETTGCDPLVDRICEVAIHRVQRGVCVDRWASLVHPGVSVGGSYAVHGIDDPQLRDAPTLRALAEPLAARLEGAIVVGHAIAFDLAFLGAAAARGEVGPMPTRALDTRALAQRALRTGSTALASLARDLGLPEPTHRAEPDVLATRALFDRVVTELRPRTPHDLWQAQQVAGPATMRTDVAQQLAAGLARERMVDIRYRVPGRDPFIDRLAVSALRPPWVDGWLAGKGVRRTLRGDRILWAEVADEAIPTARRVKGRGE